MWLRIVPLATSCYVSVLHRFKCATIWCATDFSVLCVNGVSKEILNSIKKQSVVSKVQLPYTVLQYGLNIA